MHVHGNHMNPNPANLYSAVAAEKAASAKRAAQVRKKLISGASKIAGEVDADAISMIGEGGSRQRQDQKNPRASKNKQNADEKPSDDPISMWA